MTETLSSPRPHDPAAPAYRTKLIEVALPLEAINKESAREKSIRHGHPSTLHLWWSRKPLATCRAVLFAQLVDDPSACPEEFPSEEAQEAERQRLFRIIEELVKWESSNNQTVLNAARKEIARSVARSEGLPAPETVEEVQRVLAVRAPPVLDPFCGGGSIPLEAQRLGLEAHASDLNPVAVLITKALIEIPPKFAGMPPVNPEARSRLLDTEWTGARGLAEDVRYYGKWMRDEAWKRIGHLYPRVKLPPEQGGGEATVIAWLWARTVRCPNPACGAQMPLASKWWLSTKKGKETWVEPVVDHEAKTVRFEVRTGQGKAPEGTVNRRGAKCIVCDSPVPFDHVRTEGRAGRMGQKLMAVVAEGQSGRVYAAPTVDQETVAAGARAEWSPRTDLPEQALGFRVQLYGMTKHAQLFSPRQLLALTTFTDLVGEVRHRVSSCGGTNDYADAVGTYLAFAVDRSADKWATLSLWNTAGEKVEHVFGRNALSMTWDFAEGNPFSASTGNWSSAVEWVSEVTAETPAQRPASVQQSDASSLLEPSDACISTDPPYYDNVPYADLSDFFYIWLRHSLRDVYPNLLSTLLTPKAQELIADPYKRGGREGAERFFEEGLREAFGRMQRAQNPQYPLALYYAFKQAEAEADGGTATVLASTGWETMLRGLIASGFGIVGTWPMRTERSGRLRETGSNALASSIVLVCRRRPASAPLATRGEFLSALRRELPGALRRLQHGSIAPVDLAQAAIGPGMAVFSRYSKVLEASGNAMPVRTALQIINQILDEVLAEQESEYDADTRWAVSWFEQFGVEEGPFGQAETLSKAKDTSVGGLVAAGILSAKAGKVRLLRRDELPAHRAYAIRPYQDPATDRRFTIWELTQHLIRVLQSDGEHAAADLLRKVGANGEIARDLAYRLYTVAERKGWAQEALAYNSLGMSWPEITRLAANEPGMVQVPLTPLPPSPSGGEGENGR